MGADAYGQFMGRWSEPLSRRLAPLLDLGDLGDGRALDVGCGPGAMTAVLVDVLGPARVSAVDPSEAFVAAARSRLPEVDIRAASAEQLPFESDTFGCAVAQLVVHFMDDPQSGLAEMARVTRPGGAVAACVWDHAGGQGPLSLFWRAVNELDGAAHDESGLPGAREGDLARLFSAAGLVEVQPSVLRVRVGFATFEDWWTPYTLGVGPAGAYVAALDDDHREALRGHCRALAPESPFEVVASAWTAVGRA